MTWMFCNIYLVITELPLLIVTWRDIWSIKRERFLKGIKRNASPIRETGRWRCTRLGGGSDTRFDFVCGGSFAIKVQHNLIGEGRFVYSQGGWVSFGRCSSFNAIKICSVKYLVWKARSRIPIESLYSWVSSKVALGNNSALSRSFPLPLNCYRYWKDLKFWNL